MSKVILCRICLRTDVGARDIPEALVELHDDLCDYDIYQDKTLKYCPICEHELRKFNNFRKRCQQANKVLKTCQQKKQMNIPEYILEQLSPSRLGLCNSKTRHKVYEFLHSDLQPDFEPDLNFVSDLTLIKTETDDIERNIHNIFITKDIINNSEENNLETINFESVTQNTEFLDNFGEVLQKDDSNRLQEDDLPLSDLKDESNLDFYSDYDDVNDLNYSLKDESIYKPKEKVIKSLKVKPRGKSKAKTKLSEVKYEEIDEVSLAELIQKCGVKDKLVKARQKFLKNKAKLRDRILDILDTGQFDDLGDNIKMSKEIFIKIFSRYDKCDNRMLTIKPDSPELAQKLKKFLLYLLRKYNPEYETVFDVEYLDTDDKKLQEFLRRKDGKTYIESAFKCELCYKGFDAFSHLEYHNKWHTPSPNDIVCTICPMRFVSKSTYKAHRKNNHSVVYTCKQCPVVTYHFSVMVNHYNQHRGVEYHCPTCLSVYTNKTTLNNHRREAHATSHVCTACARSFVSEKGLFFHRKYKHKEAAGADGGADGGALCGLCGLTFDSSAVLARHEWSAHTRRPESVYKCYFCKDGFDSIEALRKHKLEYNHQRAPKKVIHRTSIGVKPVGVRRTRRTRVTDPDKPTRKCTVCQAEVLNSFPTSLYMHYQEAHPDVPYNSVYTDSKDYLCEQCGKTFRVYCHYLDHRNQHTGAKPYACKECSARFATRKHLVYHSERHRPPRYQCKQCGKLFLSAANLFAHRRGHIGDRRFKCEICFKGFLHSYTLKEHIKGVHNQIRRVRKLPAKNLV